MATVCAEFWGFSSWPTNCLTGGAAHSNPLVSDRDSRRGKDKACSRDYYCKVAQRLPILAITALPSNNTKESRETPVVVTWERAWTRLLAIRRSAHSDAQQLVIGTSETKQGRFSRQ